MTPGNEFVAYRVIEENGKKKLQKTILDISKVSVIYAKRGVPDAYSVWFDDWHEEDYMMNGKTISAIMLLMIGRDDK